MAMALMSLNEAARRVGVTTETIEQWAGQGLIRVYEKRPELPPDAVGFLHLLKVVDEEALEQVAEDLGWLYLSSEGWGGAEPPRHPYRRGDVLLIQFPFSD